MKWLNNIYNPYRRDAIEKMMRGPGETRAEASERQRRYLDGKIIGEPMATKRTADLATLRLLHMVGVYQEEEEDER